MKYENIVNEKDKLQKLLNNNGVASDNADEHQQLLQLKYKNYQLEQDIKDLKQKLHINNADGQQQRNVPSFNDESHVDKNFQEQIPVSDDHYKIPINVVNIRNKSNMVKEPLKRAGGGLGDKNIINSVENFQILPQPIIDNQNVLQQPVLNGKSSTTTTTTPTSIIKKENQAVPRKKQTPSSGSTTTKSSKKLPKFVLPIPDLKNDETIHETSKEDVKEENKKSAFDETLNKPQNNDEVNENENGAHEINDNDFNIEEKIPRNHFESLDQDRNNMINNAAEEFDAHKPLDKKALVNDEMDLEIIRPQNGVNVKDKLKDEIKNDHGKEEYQEEDLHIEQQEDDLGDSESQIFALLSIIINLTLLNFQLANMMIRML